MIGFMSFSTSTTPRTTRQLTLQPLSKRLAVWRLGGSRLVPFAAAARFEEWSGRKGSDEIVFLFGFIHLQPPFQLSRGKTLSLEFFSVSWSSCSAYLCWLFVRPATIADTTLAGRKPKSCWMRTTSTGLSRISLPSSPLQWPLTLSRSLSLKLLRYLNKSRLFWPMTHGQYE